MSTFSGRYIKEPSDLLVVATEAQIILALCDGRQVRAQTFADLSDEELSVIVAVANKLIEGAEATLESYAQRRGYALPLLPVNSDVMEVLAQWVWIGALQRGGTLSVVDANKQRQELRDGPLEDIATGNLILTAGMNTTADPPSSNVHSISDSVSRATDGSVERVSRQSLAVW